MDTIFEKTNHSQIYSDEISKKLNIFYSDNKKLLIDKFETNKQIYSYLAGVYYRYGQNLDSCIYTIHQVNSSKHYVCYELLTKVYCDKILSKYVSGRPSQFKFYFEPTTELKKYLDAVELEKEILEKSYLNQYTEMLAGTFTREDIKRRMQEGKEKDLANFKSNFK